MRAAEHQGVHLGILQRLQVTIRNGEQFIAGGNPGLNELDKARAGLGEDFEVSGGGESVFVSVRIDGAVRADYPNPLIFGVPNRRPRCRLDHLNHRDTVGFGEPLPSIPQHRSGRRVTGDHQQLDALRHEVIHDVERITAHLGNRLRAVWRMRGVANVENRLTRQLVDDGAGDREATNSGVEDPNRRVSHSRQVYPGGGQAPAPPATG